MKNKKQNTSPVPGHSLLQAALTHDAPRPIFADRAGLLPGAVVLSGAAEAAAAAEGFARASGQPGAVISASAIEEPLAAARAAGAPVVFVALSQQPADAQDARWSVRVRDAAHLTVAIRQAMINTLAAAPGPVLVWIEPSILDDSAPARWPSPPHHPPLDGDVQDVEATAAALSVSQSPVILLGPSLRFTRHPEAIAPFAVRMEAPCFAIGSAAGALSADSRFAYRGGLSAALAGADLVLAFGIPASSPLLSSLPALAFLIQVDLDQDAFSPSADVCIRADAGRVMAQLTEHREDDGWLMQARAFEQAEADGLAPSHQALLASLSGVVVCDADVAMLPIPAAIGQQLVGPPGTGSGLACGAAWGLAEAVCLLTGSPPLLKHLSPIDPAAYDTHTHTRSPS